MKRTLKWGTSATPEMLFLMYVLWPSRHNSLHKVVVSNLTRSQDHSAGEKPLTFLSLEVQLWEDMYEGLQFQASDSLAEGGEQL